MATINSLNISTFNCTGIKSSIEYISGTLCPRFNIIALQELWNLPNELDICDNIHKDFNSFTKSSVNVERAVLRGRPYGGLGFMWHCSLDAYVSPVPLDDDRLLGLRVRKESQDIIFINVYMPTQSNDNFDHFMSLLGKVVSIMQDDDADSVCILGDFNANINGPFYTELSKLCTSKHLLISDVAALPPSSYTFYSDAHGTTS